ncbi:MAG: FAD/NAD(P)-binding oxidoreductase [Acidobacteriota bacterium]
MRQAAFDVVVVGGGPAGVSAAVAAARLGAAVAVVDGGPAPGGVVWGAPSARRPRGLRRVLDRFAESGAAWFGEHTVVDLPEAGLLLVEGPGGTSEFRARNLVLATGARERFLPFPGWTLPNVVGVGGLQRLLKHGLAVRGRRAVLVGTGPLLPAVGAELAGRGAEVVLVAEQAKAPRLARLAPALLRRPGKLFEAVGYLARLRNRYGTGWRPVRAEGTDRVERVTLQRGGRSLTVPCDVLGIGFGLVPNTEAARLLRCRLEGGYVWVDERLATSVTGVWAAGELVADGGVEFAVASGFLAGAYAAGATKVSGRLRRRLRAAAAFARVLGRVLSLDPELRAAVTDATVVCRCEDVPWGAVRTRTSARDAKLQTRCGMGPCQGRVCGPAVEFLAGWNGLEGGRPPLFPTAVHSWLGEKPGD